MLWGLRRGMTMAAVAKKRKFWALMGILIFLLLNYPLLQIFNQDSLLGGIPVLFWYLLGVWLVAIAGLYAFGGRSPYRE
jgi:hypothetical protein